MAMKQKPKQATSRTKKSPSKKRAKPTSPASLVEGGTPRIHISVDKSRVVTLGGSPFRIEPPDTPRLLVTPQRTMRNPRLQFFWNGDLRYAEPCADTVSAVRYEYPIYAREIDQIRKVTRDNPDISITELQKRFEDSRIAKGADQRDWEIWREDFRKSSGSAKAKSHALTFLQRKLGLQRLTLKSYLKRGSKTSKP
jgi:hypothetical protein